TSNTGRDTGDIVWIDNLQVTTTEGEIYLPDTGMRSVDLSVLGVTVVCNGDSAEVEVVVSFGSCGPTEGDEVSFSLDATMDNAGVYHGVPVVALPFPNESTCPANLWPDCDSGWCDTIMVWHPDTETWEEVFPDCVEDSYGWEWYCYCQHDYIVGFMIPLAYKDLTDHVLEVVVDQGNDVDEWREDNNEFTLAFGPTAVKQPTWSTLKVKYR
ncbi:MAG: hypothetical protein KAW17_11645, partial [Candidatus Eisenbacteria sp.]|nr:hypothetical protein [Candidatus Eisenbacteria bacterium]